MKQGVVLLLEGVNDQSLRRIPVPTGIVEFVSDTEVELLEGGNDSFRTKSAVGDIPRQSFFGLLKGIIKSNLKVLPRRLMKDAIWLVPLAVIWMVLWPLTFNTLMYLPGPIRSLIPIVIFLTATYNGFIGKAAFITVISRTFIPMFRKIRAGQWPAISAKYRETARMLSGIMAQSQRVTLKLFLMFGGLGLIASNVLTRNNKIDKYLVCVLCAIALFDDLSQGAKSPVVKLFSTALRDLPMLAGKTIKVSMNSAYLSLAGFAAGLLLAIVPSVFVTSFYSPAGFISGIVLILAGLGLHLTEGGNAKKQP
jgi:hypothetical protein